jgi:hypothetical protein
MSRGPPGGDAADSAIERPRDREVVDEHVAEDVTVRVVRDPVDVEAEALVHAARDQHRAPVRDDLLPEELIDGGGIGIDRSRALGDSLNHVRLLVLQHTEITLGRPAVNRRSRRDLFLALLLLHRAARDAGQDRKRSHCHTE